jgi:hypothetical protein
MEAGFRCSALKSVLPNKYLARNLCSTGSDMWWCSSVKLSLCPSTYGGRGKALRGPNLSTTRNWMVSFTLQQFTTDTNWAGDSVGLTAYIEAVTIANVLPLSGIEPRCTEHVDSGNSASDILEVAGFSFDRNADCSYWDFSWLFSIPPGECQDSALKYAATASFQILLIHYYNMKT